jgi:hypothetical protein
MAAETIAGAWPRDDFASHAEGRSSGRLLISLTRWAPLALVILCSVVARGAVALLVKTPLYYPDEFFYTSFARSIAASGFPSFLGQPVAFVSLLAPVSTAPAWLISNVDVAYRVAQAEGVVAFSLAALPAYAIARRLNLTRAACLAAAAAAVLLPDGMHSATLMSEPFAYPLFLTAIAVAMDALTNPSPRRDAAVIGLAALLCFARIQFAFFPVAYLCAAWIFSGRRSPRAALSAHPLFSCAIAAAGLAAVSLGPSRILGVYSGITSFDVGPSALARWSLLNVVALAIASGWAIVPGASIAVGGLLRRGTGPERAFAALTVLLVPIVVLQAAVFGVAEGKLIERYTFYVAPLVVIGFLVAMRMGVLRRRSHAIAAGWMVAVALLLPTLGFFSNADGQAAVLFALRPLKPLLGDATPLAAISLLAAVSVAVWHLGRRGQGIAIAAIAGALGVVAAGAASAAMVATAARATVPDLGLREPATLVTSTQASEAATFKTLFWNRNLGDVSVLSEQPVGLGHYSAPVASFQRGGILQLDGRELAGPVVFDGASSTLWIRGSRPVRRHGFTIVRNARATRVVLVVDGWATGSRYLQTSGRFRASPPRGARGGPQTISLRLRSASTMPQTMTFRCGSRVWRAVIGAEPETVTLPMKARPHSCWFGLTHGVPVPTGRGLASVEVMGTRLS